MSRRNGPADDLAELIIGFLELALKVLPWVSIIALIGIILIIMEVSAQ